MSEGLIETVPQEKAMKVVSKALRSVLTIDCNCFLNDDESIGIDIVKRYKWEDKEFKFVDELYAMGYYLAASAFNGRGNEPRGQISPKTTGKPEITKEEVKQALKSASAEYDDWDIRWYFSFEQKFEPGSSPGKKYLYHITDKKYLDKILKIGLVPKSKPKLTFHPDRIYLGDLEVLETIIDTYLEYVANPVLLKIDITGLKLSRDNNATQPTDDKSEGIAYFTSENISPKRITVALNPLTKGSLDELVFKSKHSKRKVLA